MNRPSTQPAHKPAMSTAGLAPSHPVQVLDEYGMPRDVHVAGERPLTLYVDKREIVTLMTLGSAPELLALGYLRNQGFVETIDSIVSVQVDWETGAAAVTTSRGVEDWEGKLARRTVTTGCGQGTVFGNLMDKLDGIRLPAVVLRQSAIYRTLQHVSEYNEVYRVAGAVHGCALCRGDAIEIFVEDVGRHNAADAIAGHMWLEGLPGAERVFYTTGRLTSEMVIKVAMMGIPILVSRSGVTSQGLDLARRTGVTLIARAKGRHFLVYNGARRVVFDAIPPAPPGRGQPRHGG
ncbi:formate dehydrogenase [Thioalkalivibrio paradoxus ARh 1]|uniref:Sulfur carrier protein FdhD n=2 Tax=Thioalkalivibrio paradoxus TaxID=108010 RepID=W0DF62_9GAMM|nr:formate dehydrogenase [Thioalkalivibrio paradoxus ARh 1]